MAAKKRGATLMDKMSARNKALVQTGDAATDSLLVKELNRRTAFTPPAKIGAADSTRTWGLGKALSKLFGKKRK